MIFRCAMRREKVFNFLFITSVFDVTFGGICWDLLLYGMISVNPACFVARRRQLEALRLRRIEVLLLITSIVVLHLSADWIIANVCLYLTNKIS